MVDLQLWVKKLHPATAKFRDGDFLFTEINYRHIKRMKVSNAMINIPKAIRSWKEKFFMASPPISSSEVKPPLNTVAVDIIAQIDN